MPTADRLRHEISSGRTGDKVPYPDPAAAPLGTDEEAAGTPPSDAEVERAERAEIGGNALRAPAVTDERVRDYSGEFDRERRRQHRWQAIYMLVTAGVLLALGMWVMQG